MNYVEIARVRIDGILCHYRLRKYNENWAEKSWTDHCPLCNSKLLLNDDFYLVINNSSMFPNSLVHARCVTKSSSVDGLMWMDFRGATIKIHKNYRAYKALSKAWTRY